MKLLKTLTAVGAAALMLLACDEGPNAQELGLPTIDLEEVEVPWASSRPRDPFASGADEVWFVGQRSNYAARYTPSTDEFERFDLPDGAGPHNLIVGEDGIVWYAGNRDAHIGTIDPATGEMTRVDMPNEDAYDPHTLVFDGRGNIWFTVQGGNFVGRLAMETRAVDLIEVPTSNARPYGIRIDSNGVPWIVEFNSNKLLTIDPETLGVTEIELPREDARPRRIEITSDDRIWYVDYSEGYLGRYDPVSGEFAEWAMPSGGGARPYAMAVDARDVVWFVETGPSPNNFVGFDANSESFTSLTPIPSGAGAVRHMHYHAETETIWFGTDENTLGHAHVGRRM